MNYKKKCRVCGKIIEIESRFMGARNRETRLTRFDKPTSKDGELHLQSWFCNDCIKEMRIHEVSGESGFGKKVGW